MGKHTETVREATELRILLSTAKEFSISLKIARSFLQVAGFVPTKAFPSSELSTMTFRFEGSGQRAAANPSMLS
jgi:hypothetical protein